MKVLFTNILASVKTSQISNMSSVLQPPGAVIYAATERNKPHILECLQRYITPGGGEGDSRLLLEVSSGTGQHMAHFAPHFPHVTYQPTEYEPRLLTSIEAFRSHLKLANVLKAATLDVTSPPQSWLNGSIHPASVDYLLNVNMIHIAPYACTEGLFAGAGYVLKPGGYLFMYGPFAVDGKITPESNVNFDRSLRSQDPDWGLRDISRQLVPLAHSAGLKLANTHDLPANNKFLAWLKQ